MPSRISASFGAARSICREKADRPARVEEDAATCLVAVVRRRSFDDSRDPSTLSLLLTVALCWPPGRRARDRVVVAADVDAPRAPPGQKRQDVAQLDAARDAPPAAGPDNCRS